MLTCTPEFARLTEPMAGLRCDANPIVEFRNPFGLQNWTFPVIETLLIIGAIACLIHAIRWYRTQHDMTNVVVWSSLVLALVVVEPIAYFPWWFGLENRVPLTFAHGEFSVQFLYDRMPLYIVAMYPVYGYLAFVLVQRTGIIKRFNRFVAACAVAATFFALYEVTDSVGPQFGWWRWNTEVVTSNPAIGTIPFASLITFSLALPFGISLLALLFCTPGQQGAGRYALNTVIVSILVWPVFIISQLPAQLLDAGGLSAESGRAIMFWVSLVVIFGVGLRAYIGAMRARATDPALVPDASRTDFFPLICVLIYFPVITILWIVAFPGGFDSANQLTPVGTHREPAIWGALNFLVAVAITFLAYRGTTSGSAGSVTLDDESTDPGTTAVPA